MKQLGVRVAAGILLIVLGGLFLLQTLGILANLLSLLWPLLFALGGAVFVYVFLLNRESWWAIIPGLTLLGIAALMALSELFPRLGAVWGGAMVLGAIGASFVIVYLVKPERWWAIIPSGVLLTLAAVSVLSSFWTGAESGGLLFLGLGLTFGVLSLVPTPQGRLRWALIPAIVLLIIGSTIMLATVAFLRYLWAVALILGGLYLILRVQRLRRQE